MPPAPTVSKATGFTLIEISIVLVIIGLIAGSVLVGRDLIKQSELRSVITDAERYNTAVNAFRTKYNCLPGDCANATDFFGTQTGGGGCPYPTVVSGSENPLTCNGNGSLSIWGSSEPPGPYLHERLRFWQQLSAAGLVGHFTGIGNTSMGEPINTQSIMFGFNAPQTKLDKSGLSVYHGSTLNTFGFNYFKPLDSVHIFVLGTTDTCDPSTCITHNDPVAAASAGITPELAFMLDRKVDDGKPGSGAITAPPTDGGHNGNSWFFCTTGDHTQAQTAEYNLTVKTPVCPLFLQATF